MNHTIDSLTGRLGFVLRGTNLVSLTGNPACLPTTHLRPQYTTHRPQHWNCLAAHPSQGPALPRDPTLQRMPIAHAIVNTKRNIDIVTNIQVPLQISHALLPCQTHFPTNTLFKTSIIIKLSHSFKQSITITYLQVIFSAITLSYAITVIGILQLGGSRYWLVLVTSNADTAQTDNETD